MSHPSTSYGSGSPKAIPQLSGICSMVLVFLLDQSVAFTMITMILTDVLTDCLEYTSSFFL